MTASPTTRRTHTYNSQHDTVATHHTGADETPVQLTTIINESKSRDELYSKLLTWLTKHPEIAAAGFFEKHSDNGIVPGPHNFEGPAFESETFVTAVSTVVETAIQTGCTQTTDVQKIRNLVIVSVPIGTNDDRREALSAAVVTTPDNPSDTHLLTTVASFATLWHANQQQTATRNQLGITAATLDLLSIIETATNFRSSCISLTSALRDHLKCRGVVLALTKGRRNQQCHIEAMSGLPEVDVGSSLGREMCDALNESVDRNGLSIFPVEDSENRMALLAHRKLCGNLQATRIISHPLLATDGTAVGAWMTIEDSDNIPAETSATLLRAAATRVADSLKIARQANTSLFTPHAKGQDRFRWLRRSVMAATVVTSLLLVPIPYRIHCDCSAEPDVRRFIVAPHEGLIENTFVMPGDVVTKGQLLAKMNGRSVRWELAGLAAEREKAAKESDTELLQGNAAAAQRANLELRRVQAREAILNQRFEQLEVRSPVDGIVLDGHLDRVENAPVTIGQALYEVAPLSPVTVEVAIPDDEYSNVRQGFEVTVSFDGINTDFNGTVNRIHPRSEIRDADNVFIAEVILTNTHEQLRPGMTGYARIKGETHSLGWNLFHKPWEHLKKSIPF